MNGYSVARTYLQIYHELTTTLTDGWSYMEIRELALELTKEAVRQ